MYKLKNFEVYLTSALPAAIPPVCSDIMFIFACFHLQQQALNWSLYPNPLKKKHLQ